MMSDRYQTRTTKELNLATRLYCNSVLPLAISIFVFAVACLCQAETLRVPCTAWAESALDAPGGQPRNFAGDGTVIHFGAWPSNIVLPGTNDRFGYFQFDIPEQLAGKAILQATVNVFCLQFINLPYVANANFTYIPTDDWTTGPDDRFPLYAEKRLHWIRSFAEPGNWYRADVTGLLLLSGEGPGQPLSLQILQEEHGVRGIKVAGPKAANTSQAPYLEIKFLEPDDGPPIAMADDAGPVERNAAYLLQKFITQVTGQVPAIKTVSRSDPLPDAAIVVGRGWIADQAGVDLRAENLKPDGFIIRPANGRLVLTGADGRGVLYAVMDYLEQDLGCRWLAPGRTIIPQGDHYPLHTTARREEPTFTVRELTFTSDELWKAANRSTATSGLWGKNHVQGQVNPHSMHDLVPGSRFFEAHPDWFPEQNGISFHGGGQHNYHNRELKEFVAEKVIDDLRQHPEWTDYWLAQRDVLGWSQNTASNAVDSKEGSTTASHLQFVNHVAKAVNRAIPGTRIHTLAYHYTLTPPRTMSYHPNVRLYIATPWSFHNTANITDSGVAGQYYLKMVRNWTDKCNDCIAWMYHIEGPNELSWYLDTLQQDYRALRDAGIDGIFVEMGQAPYEDLKAYLLQRLFWNIDADVDQLVYDFHEGYFGTSAAPKMLEYYQLVCSDPGNYGSRAAWLTKLDHILREVRPLVADDDFAASKVDLLIQAVLANKIKALWPEWTYHDGTIITDTGDDNIDSLFERVRVLGESSGRSYPTREQLVVDKPAVRLANDDLEVIFLPETGALVEIRDLKTGRRIARGTGSFSRPIHVTVPPYALTPYEIEEADPRRLKATSRQGNRIFTKSVVLPSRGTSLNMTTTMTQEGALPESDALLTRFEFNGDNGTSENHFLAYRDGSGQMHLRPIDHPWECFSSSWGPSGLIAILDGTNNTGLLWEFGGQQNGGWLRIGPSTTDTLSHLGTRRNFVLDLYGQRTRVGLGETARHQETITLLRDARSWCRAQGLHFRQP